MQYRVCFLMLLMTVFIGNIPAQHQASQFKINFNTDEHLLDKSDEAILNQLIDASRNAPYYEVTLTGHTDSDADDTYNVKLSQRRTQSVKAYLSSHHIDAKRMVSASFGERKPEADNNNNEGKAVNRRVDITLNIYTIHSSSDLIKQVSPEYQQMFSINAQQENTITGKHGTTVVIPANGVTTKSGKPVTGNVKIILQEFLKPTDAAFNQLSTVSNGKMLESGGMFSIQATANNEEVVLKKGNAMQVNMPTINMKNEMSLFTAVVNKEGLTEWKPTNIPFRPAGFQSEKTIAFVNLDTKYLESLMTDCGEKPNDAAFYYELPAMPNRPPNFPKKPQYVAPVFNKIFPWYKRLVTSREEMDAKFAKIVERREKSFDKRLVQYEKSVAKLEPMWAKYKIDSARFEHEELEKLRTWLNTQFALHVENTEYIEKSQWNVALKQLITLSRNNALTRTDMKEQFLRSIGPLNMYYLKSYQHQRAMKVIGFLTGKSMTQIVTLTRNKKALNLNKPIPNTIKLNGINPEATYAQQQLNESPALLGFLDMAKSILIKKQMEARAFDESNVGNVYTVALSSFGSFNCDRFYQTPPEQMVTITVTSKEEARVAFFVPKFNSFMYASRSENGYSATMPKGTAVKIIYVSFNKKEGPLLDIQNQTFTNTNTFLLNPKTATLAQIHKALSGV